MLRANLRIFHIIPKNTSSIVKIFAHVYKMSKEEPIMVNTVTILKRLKRQNMTQGDLAEKTGLSRKTIGTILNTSIIKTRSHLSLFADALGVSEESLLMSESPGEKTVLTQRGGDFATQHQNYKTGDNSPLDLLRQVNDLQQQRIRDLEEKLREREDQIRQLRGKN